MTDTSIKKWSHSGFTLLEMVIALGLISTALFAVFRLQAQNLDLQTEAQFITIATQLARDRISRIQSGTDLSEGSFSGDFGDAFPGFHFEEEISKTSDHERLYKVSVHITHDAATPPRDLSVATFLFFNGAGS